MNERRPHLRGSPRENAAELQRVFASQPPGRVLLPPGRHVVAGSIVLTDDWSLHGMPGADGSPRTTLVQATATAEPFVHVLGSHTAVCDVVLDVPAAHPGPHDGDKWTALTVGRYLYEEAPEWQENIVVHRVHVFREGRCPANSIAVMGAVRQLELTGSRVRGGGTAVAVHWGALGGAVDQLTGASYHPHELQVTDLYVRDAYEGFYLSSVHDVTVTGCRMDDVEIGFRLLPGDNTDRFHEAGEQSPVSSRISVSDCEIDWFGDLYALRVAGWGRSEVDHQVSVLGYRDLTISDVVVRPHAPTGGHRTPGQLGRVAVVVENAGTVNFERLRLTSALDVVPVRLDGQDLPLSALTGLLDTKS